MLAIKSTEKLWASTEKGPRQIRADRLVSQVDAAGWSTISAGDGAKGPRVYDWTMVKIRPLQESAKGYWLLARRSHCQTYRVGLLRVLWPSGNNLGGTGQGGRNPLGPSRNALRRPRDR